MQVDASTGVDRSGTPFTLLCTYVLAGLGFGCMVGWGLVGVFSPSLSLLSYEGITQSLVLRSIGIAAITGLTFRVSHTSGWDAAAQAGLLAVVAAIAVAAAVAAYDLRLAARRRR